jgi:hypothetical protein
MLEATLGVGGRHITQDDATTQEPVDMEAELHEFLRGTYDAPWFDALTHRYMVVAAEAGVGAVGSIIREVSQSMCDVVHPRWGCLSDGLQDPRRDF